MSPKPCVLSCFEVEFLDECSPALIERNAAEFGRTRDLLVSAEPSVHRARHGTVWENVHRQNFDARLSDVGRLLTGLAESLGKARTALVRYADEVEAARRHLAEGVHAEHTLGSLISQVAVPVTRTAQQAEPMRQWDDIRATTGFLDWLAELGVNADSVREAATRAYNQAGEAFGRARSVEQAARDTCLAKSKAAYEALPDFRGGDFTDAAVLARSIDPLLKEITQAGNDPASQLPGSGAKADGLPGAAAAAVSPGLQRIRDLLRSLPPVHSQWWHDFEVISGDDERKEWINDHKETPENLPWRLGGDRDETSYGPMAVQIRRGAEALGYDPENLSDQQRDEVRSALQDPAQNIFVAAKHLSDLKAETGFAHVPADEMTVDHYAELAARYNGGPHWQETQAQDYGRYVAEHRHTVQEVLR